MGEIIFTTSKFSTWLISWINLLWIYTAKTNRDRVLWAGRVVPRAGQTHKEKAAIAQAFCVKSIKKISGHSRITGKHSSTVLA